jgi:PAS domain S-box-containing protein
MPLIDAKQTVSQSTVASGDGGCRLDDVVTTEQLAQRPSRPPQLEAENKALVALARELVESPQTILKKLVDTALALCNADSAGISILEHAQGQDLFRWHATAGALAPYLGGTMPRGFSPCGTVLDRNAAQLMTDPGRFYPDVKKVQPQVVEVLLIPFYRGETAIGTVWVVSHTAGKQFQLEDERLVTSLAKFASAAVAVLANLSALETANKLLRTEASERVAAENARQETEEFHRFAAEAGRTGSWYVRLDTMECILSPIMAELMGFPAGQNRASAQQWRDSVVPEDRAGLEGAITASIERDVPFDHEFRIALPNGTHRWLYSHGGVVRDASGKALRLHGASVDITERRRADERARTILDTISDAFFALDREWRFIYVNPQADRLLDRAPGDLLGRVIWEALPGLIGSDFERAYHRTMNERAAVATTSFYPDHDRWYEAHSYPSPEGISIYFRDVSEPKRAEEERLRLVGEMERQSRIFDTTLSSITDFAYILDRNARFLYANKALLDLWGIKLEEAIGKDFFDLKYPADLAAKLARQVSQVVQTRKGLSDQTPYTSPTGAAGYYEYIFSPVFAADGSVEAVAGSTRDVTAMKEAEAALQQAKETAESANCAKDKFLAVLSHELRTPLSPVAMTIPAMESDPEMPAKFHNDLTMVRRNVDLEVKLIDDLLDLSRITTGKLRLQLQPVGVHELLRHAIYNSTSDASSKRIVLREELDATNDRMTADPGRLQQVFWNLLRNAVKFTSDGGGITVRTWNAAGSDRLHIEVRDDGVGIDPELLPKIFDAFEQGDARMTRQFGGLGLGLAIAKAVVEMHGGQISAASEGRGKGASFIVILDTAPINSLTDTGANSPREGNERSILQRRVLLVEDHPDTARMLARLLRHEGFEVETAGSVASALQLAAAQTFDVVVSDIGLPDATGYELMEQIRDRHGIKGIALSGYGMDDDMRKSREAGFVDHVVKPVNIAQLQAVIHRVLSGD